MSEYFIVKWLHIIAMAYWLGGEWGVFNTSRYVVDPKLDLDERHRHMETAHRIDILPRTGIILLLPLGLHLGNLLGVQPLGGPWLVGMWIFGRGSPRISFVTVVLPTAACPIIVTLMWGLRISSSLCFIFSTLGSRWTFSESKFFTK